MQVSDFQADPRKVCGWRGVEESEVGHVYLYYLFCLALDGSTARRRLIS